MKSRANIIVLMGLFALGLGWLLLPQTFKSQQVNWRAIEWEKGRSDERVSLPAELLPEGDAVSLGASKIKWFKQAVAGVPIEGSFVKIVEEAGQTTMVQGRVLADDHLPDKSRVLSWLAIAEMKRNARQSTLKTQGCRGASDLVATLENLEGEWRLVYQTDCERNLDVLRLAFAADGELVGSRSQRYDFSWSEASVAIYPRGPVASQLQVLALPVSSEPTFLQTPNMSVRSDAELTFGDMRALSDVTPNDERFDMVQAYFYVKGALDWAKQTLNVSLPELKIRTHVGYPDRVSAAFYFGNEVRLGTGDDVSFRNMAWDPTIVVHETMHAVVEKLTRMPFQGEVGSLSEALADSLTALHLQTPRMGEGSYLSGPYQRSLEQLVLFKEKKGKLYHDSLILSGTVWQLREEVGPEVATEFTIFLLKHLNPSSDLAGTKAFVQKWFSECSLGEVCHRVGSILNKRGWL